MMNQKQSGAQSETVKKVFFLIIQHKKSRRHQPRAECEIPIVFFFVIRIGVVCDSLADPQLKTSVKKIKTVMTKQSVKISKFLIFIVLIVKTHTKIGIIQS